MKKSILNKVAGKFYFLNLLLLIAVFCLFLFYNNDSYNHGFKSSYDNMSNMISLNISHELIHESDENPRHIFNHYLSDRNIIGYAFYDSLGERVFYECSNNNKDLFPVLFPGTNNHLIENRYILNNELMHLDRKLGYFSFVVKKDDLLTRLSSNGPIYILLLISLSVLFFISTVIFHHLIISPITKLIGFSKNLIENRDYTKTIEPSGTKEIQLLGKLLNTMTEDIHNWKAESISKTKSIQESEIKFRNLFNHASDSIFIMDGNNFIDCNKKTLEMFNCTREQILGQPPTAFSPAKQPDGTDSIISASNKIKAVLEGKPQYFEWKHCTFDKTNFDAEVSLNRIQLSGNYYIQAIVRDITERKKFENTITDIIKGTSTIFGDEYFKAVAINLCNILKSDFTLVGKIADSKNHRIESLAFYSKDKELEKITYELEGTPCEKVVGRSICVYSDNVSEIFPNDTLLKEWEISGYAGIPLFDSQKKPIGIILTLTKDKIINPGYYEKILQLFANRTSAEIERIKSERDLAQSQKMLENVLDTIPVRVFWKDLDSKYIGYNKLFAKDADIDENESILGKLDSELIWKDDFEMYVENDRDVINSDKAIINFEEEFKRPGFPTMIIKKSKIPLKDPEGKTIGILGCYEDITDKKNFEQELKRSEIRYRTLFEQSPFPIVVHAHKKFLFANRAALKTLGAQDPVDIIGKRPLDFVHPDRQDEALKRMKLFRDGIITETDQIEQKLITLKGKVIDVELKSSIIEFEGSKAIMVSFIDISSRIEAQIELRKSQEILQAITDNTKSLIAVKDRNGRYIMVNKQFEEAFAGQHSSLINKTVFDIFPKHYAERFTKFDQLVFDTKTQQTFEEVVDDGNESKVYWVVKYPLLNEEGEPYALCDLTTDITERKKLEKEENKIEKLKSVGLLAGGIAHDFNNFLTGILGSISLALMDIEPGSELYQNLSDAEKASIRARDLTQQLLTFSKGGNPIRENSSIDDLVKETAFFSLRGSNVNLEIHTDEFVKPVKIDTGQISQVIQNLVINASQAMPEGGTIKIDMRSVILDERSSLPLLSGEYIKISIIDEGIGISEKHLVKIFDPYFTTKQHGNGLGLATCFSIIKKHDGHIETTSTVGVGTTFNIYLPISDEIITETKESDVSSEAISARVLVMDDEFFIRDLTEKMLRRFNHEALSVENGEQAIIAYRNALDSGNPFDVVLLDLTIPGGMGGKEAVKALLEIDPNVKAVVCSGYSNDPILSEYTSFGFSGVIGKPYKPEELQKVIQKILKESNQAITRS